MSIRLNHLPPLGSGFASPWACFDAVTQRRHHPVRPDRGFRPPQQAACAAGGVCSLCSRIGTTGTPIASLHTSRLQLPASLPSGRFCYPSLSTARSGLGNMKALTPRAVTPGTGSLRSRCFAVPTFRPQPRDPSPGRFISRLSAVGCSSPRVKARGSPSMSRLATVSRRNRFVLPRLRGGRLYGLSVHLRLLSTPPLGNAVTFDYRATTCPDADFHRADDSP